MSSNAEGVVVFIPTLPALYDILLVDVVHCEETLLLIKLLKLNPSTLLLV
jgi:hypothetical protein